MWYLVDKEVTPSTNPKDFVEHTKKLAKAKQIIFDSVKDHLIPHIAEKKRVKEMFDALVTLSQSVNLSRKVLLKKKLTGTHMSKIDTVASYLMKITELRDQLATIGDNIYESKLVRITPNSFGPYWHHFV